MCCLASFSTALHQTRFGGEGCLKLVACWLLWSLAAAGSLLMVLPAAVAAAASGSSSCRSLFCCFHNGRCLVQLLTCGSQFLLMQHATAVLVAADCSCEGSCHFSLLLRMAPTATSDSCGITCCCVMSSLVHSITVEAALLCIYPLHHSTNNQIDP